jgi:large subunit ribosomal protein L17
MRHLCKGFKLGREKKAREALRLNLASALILQEKIQTTAKKAKLTVAFAERLVNLAKAGKKRELLKKNLNRNVLAKLMEEVSKWYSKRKSGYFKVVSLYYRKGDHTKVVQISFVPKENIPSSKTAKQKTKKK